ncbi:MAG: NUDIX hydrolase [Lachnospiraceae bacterium]|nr:NUDIX hydrolase [Lachnospiraceae bacterium]
MDLLQEIENYMPGNQQEEQDKKQMVWFIKNHSDYLDRANPLAHFTASMWTVNKEHTKTLMVHHNIYDSWSWIGGHADGEEDLCAVALRELQEETGIKNAVLVSSQIFSLETLTVNGHFKKGVYVPAHVHYNATYFAEADENEALTVQENENSSVRWWSFADALSVPKEPWMIERIYKKLIERS